MSDKVDIDFIIEDLIKQATYERSHFYTANALKLIKEDRQKLQSRNAELEYAILGMHTTIATLTEENAKLVKALEKEKSEHFGPIDISNFYKDGKDKTEWVNLKWSEEDGYTVDGEPGIIKEQEKP